METLIRERRMWSREDGGNGALADNSSDGWRWEEDDCNSMGDTHVMDRRESW